MYVFENDFPCIVLLRKKENKMKVTFKLFLFLACNLCSIRIVSYGADLFPPKWLNFIK